MKHDKFKTLSLIIGLLIIIQLLLFGIKYLLFIYIERTNYTDSIASMIGMMILSIALVIYARNKRSLYQYFRCVLISII